MQSVVGRPDGRFEIALEGHDHRYAVRIQRAAGGPPRLVELSILSDDDSAEITPATVRQIPVRRLAAAAARFDAPSPFVTPDELYDPTAAHRPERRRGGRGNKLDDVHYRQVAALLVAARENGEAPRAAVAASFHVSVPTVNKWISIAKDRGYLARDWATSTNPTSTEPETRA
ncbi:hypothetical protein [Tsukamurella sp. NPDC003166]|uniref:hypothetical protein n=1 Tax=Tsukamurella sp. NPDC003166 TaxID=3154444 RepID=UPI0033B8EA4C